MKDHVEVGGQERWLGRTLDRPIDLEDAALSFDRQGDRFFVRDRNGRVLEVTGGEQSPIYPLVMCTWWKNFGKNNEEAVETKVSVVDFLAEKPVVIDIENEPTE